ncbi:MAG: double-strand break repair protein AddB [Alphaproteobacteria bacterium]|nr:double-strand break repair protein AddB [Alphaproteobacteria bacterium]
MESAPRAIEPPRGIYTIPPDVSFVDALARGLLDAWGDDPLGFSTLLVLVPTRRAVRALREAFLRATSGRPLLLPRLQPIGDVEEGDEVGAAAALGEDDVDSVAVPPPIDPLAREALLTRLVLAFRDDDTRPIAGSVAQALGLARELGRLLDELQIDGVAFEQLKGVVDAPFAAHWQQTLKFLGIIGEAWPAILAERGVIDAVDRRNRLLRQQAARWRARPPGHPVVAAGSTGTQPATRELLAVVASLPLGCVVLPGLDQVLDEAGWAAIDATHPQAGLRDLLAALGVARTAVPVWPAAGARELPARRLLSAVMRPAETTDAWSTDAPLDPAALERVARVDCATPQQEAVVAALALREALETPRRTAALVTPDRELARRVTAELQRWGIVIDDSAGIDLAHTPPGAFLRLLARALASGFAPVDLLALVKHPLAGLGMARPALVRAARGLDRRVLRGPKPEAGLAALHHRVAEAGFPLAPDREAVRDLLGRLAACVEPLLARGDRVPAVERLDDLARAAEAMAATESISGADRLWRGDAGEALALAVLEWRRHLRELPQLAVDEIPALLDTLLTGIVVRPRHGAHPRLAILGPLEARLQHADLVVLGGLNEGTWPPAVDTGPWLNRPMRAALGLPQPERRIGLAAHDFAQAFAAANVLVTRAGRVGGAPTVPSRWLARLDALLGHRADDVRTRPAYLRRGDARVVWAEALDEPAQYVSWPRPEPRPPLDARPRELSVSAIEQWRRDPYGLYARRILRLEPLDPLEAELGAADRGSALHAALEEFLSRYPDTLPPDAAAQLLRIGERELAELLKSPGERAFWWSRFERLAAWVVRAEQQRRAAGTRALAHETEGRLVIAGDKPFVVRARADRIDRRADGVWEIIDYKTGRIPQVKELRALFAPQLLLEASIARFGTFQLPVAADKPEAVELQYWQIHGRDEGGRIEPVKDAAELTEKMFALLGDMIRRFDRPDTAYIPLPWPEFGPYFNDYEHLERVTEWSSGGRGDT